jgi:translation initiation factor IF-3
VKVSVMFRGREIVHPELGRGLLERVAEQVGDAGTIDKPPTMEGRFFNMILAPGKLKEPKPRPVKPAAVAQAQAAPAVVEAPAVEETPPAEVPVASEG